MSPVGTGAGIILVEYHSGGLVAERATEAVQAGHAVVVADNSSTYDGPGIKVLLKGNVGFGAGCNRAVAELPPGIDVIVLQNPDATIEAAGLERLISSVRDGWAALAPSLFTHEYRPYGFAIPCPRREFGLVLLDLVRARRSPRQGRPPTGIPTSPAGQGDGPISMAGRFGSAALLAVDRSWYERVGGFDERYFLYVEDLDLWSRLDRAGGRVGFLPSVVAHHESSTGSSAPGSRRTLLRWLGRELWVDTVGGNWRMMRWLHRHAARMLPQDEDEVRFAAEHGMRTKEAPAEVLSRIRDLSGRF